MPRRSLEGPKKAPDLVPRNSRGGVLVTDDELKSAFEFFDVEGSGKITQAQLKKRLGVFYKDMPNKEYKFLMNDQSELTLDDLRELLLDNEVKNFDPVAEAFKVYDPEGTGFVDTTVLKAIFENLGFGEISEDDLAVLTETGDVDGDGRPGPNDPSGWFAQNPISSAKDRDGIVIQLAIPVEENSPKEEKSQ